MIGRFLIHPSSNSTIPAAPVPHLVLLTLPYKQRCHVGRQHVLQQQAVQVLPGLDLVLLRAVLVLQQEVLAEAGLVLAGRNAVSQFRKRTSVTVIQLRLLQPLEDVEVGLVLTCCEMMSMVTRNRVM